ncbi:alkaline phosphatase family protein [Natronosalvus rutilus]|uniref:Alkaline phosphatase family protein n=1 Tax=Natronosalvus rutilus TaxID=2953753 RepID=A0A9E7NAP2_9EURY|nr:alkaline phosphatase family protein [Natronosalvus rutilus]UTF54797.1 alkaline phosphatase family protein [Natronosalvus rutilus]
MSDTFVVLGLDAADYDLVKKWDCENLLLSNHNGIDTFAHSLDVPATYEVWPTIATGVFPDQHGVTLPSSWEKKNRGFRFLEEIGTRLPKLLKSPAIKIKHSVEGHETKTSLDHMFNNGDVYNWPGLTSCPDWEQEGEWFSAVKNKSMSEQNFRRNHLANAGKGIGWLSGMSQAGTPVVGAHVHILDHMGHLYGKRPEKLESIYNEVDELVGWLHDQVDRLLIVSDHGMQTTATDDPQPGVHSFRSMVSTTEKGGLPEDMTAIREWVESRVKNNGEENMTEIDAPMQHLEDLGYL